jgi:hypothetical protein
MMATDDSDMASTMRALSAVLSLPIKKINISTVYCKEGKKHRDI